jgi:hypothetical protein
MIDFMLKFSLSITLWSGFMFMIAVILEKVSKTFSLWLASGLLLSAVSWIMYFTMLIWR